MTMKKFTAAILCALGICLVAIEVHAGDAKTIYVCSSCAFQQADAGTCPQCNSALAKHKITYECNSCGMAQNDPGTCSMCGTELKEKPAPTLTKP